MKTKKILISLLFSFICVCSLQAKKTPVQNLYEYKYDNGLKLFAFENHNVPLVYIEVAVRAGGVTQTKETAGLFHLYEHMMFKGNALYPSAAAVNRALSDMGIAHWNGSTSVDVVKYFFTVPVSQLENGLAFWNAAIRFPLIDEKELENEKKVVLSEIEGDLARPGQKSGSFLMSKLFPEEPYKLDPAGDPEIIKNATADDLKRIRRDFYIPSNAAVFVGGDINPDDVSILVKKIFGTWENHGRSVPAPSVQPAKNPLAKKEFYVSTNEQMQKNVASVEVMYRAPDSDFDINDTYPADYFVNLLQNPAGDYTSELLSDEILGITNDSNYVWGGYATKRQSGIFYFGGIFMNPENCLLDRTKLFVKKVNNLITDTIPNNKKNFSSSTVNKIVRTLEEQQVSLSEVSSSILSNLCFWWSCADEKYFYSYINKLKKVKQRDVIDFSEKYFKEKKTAVLVTVHPDVLAAHKEEFEKAGYEFITEENSFWWKQPRFEFSKTTSEPVTLEKEEVYVPAEKDFVISKKDSSQKLETLYLKNGIPVYIQNNSGVHNNSLNIVFKGGISHLTRETSGLESSLFYMMASSSLKYSREVRTAREYNYGVSTGYVSKIAGSVLTLNGLDKYFYDSIEMLADGALNPDYNETVFNVLKTNLESSIQEKLTEPQSYLSYTVDEELFKNHPYNVKTSVVPDSIENITIENMKALHEKLLYPENIFVVASGNINSKKLVKKLNATIGKLKKDSSRTPFVPEASVPPVNIGGTADVKLKSESSKGTGFAMRVFETPSQTSDDYIAFSLACDIYSDILFNVVREHYGTCYSVSNMFAGSKASYGGEYLYQISDFKNFKTRVDEALGYMRNGFTVDSFDSSGKPVLVPLSERIEAYKNKYISSLYAGEQTSYSKAFSILYSIMQFDDIDRDEKNLLKLYSLTADEVTAAFCRYMEKSKGRWFIVSGE